MFYKIFLNLINVILRFTEKCINNAQNKCYFAKLNVALNLSFNKINFNFIYELKLALKIE